MMQSATTHDRTSAMVRCTVLVTIALALVGVSWSLVCNTLTTAMLVVERDGAAEHWASFLPLHLCRIITHRRAQSG